MSACVFAGDSIAVGVAHAARESGYICAVVARVGAGSGALPTQLRRAPARRLVIISIGSNDPRNQALALNALRARSMLSGKRVAWMLPYDRAAAYRVSQIAFRYNDPVLDLDHFGSRDGIHPSDYRAVARNLFE